jgi:L-histidine Nalpha-methyltransferase
LPIKIASHAATERLTIVNRPVATGDGGPSFAEAVRLGLLGRPKTLPWQYFYDERGSVLFEQICRLPEYYLTRTEDAILREHADAMVAGWDRAPTMIELGSGSSSKTRRLIAAAIRRHGALHYVPIDVSATILAESARGLVARFPTLRVTGYVANYRDELARVAAQVPGPKLWVFLGSSLGNYEGDDAAGLLGQMARASGPDDRLLLGTDLDKDPRILEAAYDDFRGVTAQFNRNLLARINRELGADFVPEQFDHRAVYRRDAGRVEMHLVSRIDQDVQIPGADLTVRFAEGESIHTESSHKYTPDGLRALAGRSGFAEETTWGDRRGWFQVQRWRPRA